MRLLGAFFSIFKLVIKISSLAIGEYAGIRLSFLKLLIYLINTVLLICNKVKSRYTVSLST